MLQPRLPTLTVTFLLLIGAETIVDIWLHSGNDSDILSSDKEVVNAEENTSGDNADPVEQQLVPRIKVEDVVNSAESQDVHDLPTKELSLDLIETKKEIDSFDCGTTCDNTSELNATVQGGRSSCDVTSSLDHDYFRVVDVNIKTERVDGYESLPGSSQESTSEDCADMCNVNSSVELDSSIQNHVTENASAVRENDKNFIPVTADLPTESAIGSNSVKEQNVSVAKNNSKLTTFVKCMDKSGHVFYLTLGKTDLKPQVKPASVVPKLEQSLKVANLASMLIKPQLPVMSNKLPPTAVVVAKSKLNATTAKAQLSNYNCKVKGSVTSQNNSGCVPLLQSNASVLVPLQGISGSVITSRNNARSLLSEGANSTFVPPQGTSTLTPLQSTNSKPGLKVTSPVILANNLSKVFTQLQSSSGQPSSFLKQSANVPTAEKLDRNNAGGVKGVNLESVKKSTPVQEQSLLIVKNGHLYLVTHRKSSVGLSALDAKSSAKKCDAIPKQQVAILSDTVQGSRSLLTNSVLSAKGGFSLLKNQTNASVPQDIDNSEDNRLVFSGRTLVLNKANSRQIIHSSKMHYANALK